MYACEIMKKKIVVKVINMNSPNWRTKPPNSMISPRLLHVPSGKGAEYMGYQREKEDDEDEVLELIGYRVDAVKQTTKKVSQAKLLVVEDHKD